MGALKGSKYNRRPQKIEQEINAAYRPDKEYTYEELLELEERIGYVSKGISQEIYDKLLKKTVKVESDCSICLLPMELDSISLELQPCGHIYHQECIDIWLENNKTCPLCLQEIAPA